VLVTGLAMAACLLPTPWLLATSTTQVGHNLALPVPPPDLAPAAAPGNADAMVAAATDAAPTGLTLGTAVLDLATGELAQAGVERFYSASLSKLMLIVDMLDGDAELSESDLSLIGRALSVSDDNAMNALWVRFDGPEAMTRVAGALGMAGTSTPDDPSQWGETEVSPAGYARLFQHILTEMDPGDRAVIVDGLSAAQPRAADGFNQFFGLLGQSAPVYAKQGWMYYGSQLYLHSAGVLHTDDRDYVVVLMSKQPARSSAPVVVNTVAAAMLAAS
jgi:hypothetical protein